jgi:hypothetical protein
VLLLLLLLLVVLLPLPLSSLPRLVTCAAVVAGRTVLVRGSLCSVVVSATSTLVLFLCLCSPTVYEQPVQQGR